MKHKGWRIFPLLFFSLLFSFLAFLPSSGTHLHNPSVRHTTILTHPSTSSPLLIYAPSVISQHSLTSLLPPFFPLHTCFKAKSPLRDKWEHRKPFTYSFSPFYTSCTLVFRFHGSTDIHGVSNLWNTLLMGLYKRWRVQLVLFEWHILAKFNTWEVKMGSYCLPRGFRRLSLFILRYASFIQVGISEENNAAAAVNITVIWIHLSLYALISDWLLFALLACLGMVLLLSATSGRFLYKHK